MKKNSYAGIYIRKLLCVTVIFAGIAVFCFGGCERAMSEPEQREEMTAREERDGNAADNCRENGAGKNGGSSGGRKCVGNGRYMG